MFIQDFFEDRLEPWWDHIQRTFGWRFRRGRMRFIRALAAVFDLIFLRRLHIAARWGSSRAISKLIERGADPNARNLIGEAPLHLAIRRNDPERAEALLRGGADANRRDGKLLHPLNLWARFSRHRDVQIPELLVEHGVDINMDLGAGRSILFDVNAEDIQALIPLGANVNSTDQDGNTLLHTVMDKNYYTWGSFYERYIPALLRVGIKQRANFAGLTPIHRAATFGYVEVLRLLLSAGGDPNARDNEGHTPLLLCRTEACLTALLAAGADPLARDRQGRTLLHKIAEENSSYYGSSTNVVTIEVAIRIGVGVDERDNRGWTALHYAASRAYLSKAANLRSLLKLRADIYAKTSDGATALSLATDSTARSLIHEYLAAKEAARVANASRANDQQESEAGKGQQYRAENSEQREARQREQREAREKEQREASDRKRRRSEPNVDLDRERALAILGLSGLATPEEVKSAYRRAVRLHHPDRFAHLPAQDREEAAGAFKRVQEAYERLTHLSDE